MTEFLNNSNTSYTKSYDEALINILKETARTNSTELTEYFNEYASQEILCDYFKMIAIADSTTLTDSFSESILDDYGRISLAYENLRTIPRTIAENYASETYILDLSFNSFKNVSFLSFFKGLNTLILDRNIKLDETTFPYLPNLEILWCNNCNINNIPKWIYKIQIQCPSLRHLSLIGNPGAKTQFTGGTNIEENDFRNFVIEMLPNLIYLDGIPVKSNQIQKIDEKLNRRQQHHHKYPNKSLLVENNVISTNNSKNIKRKLLANSFKDFFRFNIKNQSSSTS